MKKNKQKNQFVSESEFTIINGKFHNIPPSGPMKDNPVHYGKEKAVPPGEEQKKDIQKIMREAKKK